MTVSESICHAWSSDTLMGIHCFYSLGARADAGSQSSVKKGRHYLLCWSAYVRKKGTPVDDRGTVGHGTGLCEWTEKRQSKNAFCVCWCIEHRFLFCGGLLAHIFGCVLASENPVMGISGADAGGVHFCGADFLHGQRYEFTGLSEEIFDESVF